VIPRRAATRVLHVRPNRRSSFARDDSHLVFCAMELFREPKVTLLSRPHFSEPAHLPVAWLGESTDGERLAEFAGRLCYMSQGNPAKRPTREYLENIKKQGHGSVLEHSNYSL